MNKITMKSLCLVLLLALGTVPACSHFSAAGRQERVYAKQQRAYAKYLKQMRGESAKRQARVRQDLPKMPRPEAMTPSEPQETTEMSEGPQAVSSDSDYQASAATGNN
jgi:hypothetical protein